MGSVTPILRDLPPTPPATRVGPARASLVATGPVVARAALAVALAARAGAGGRAAALGWAGRALDRARAGWPGVGGRILVGRGGRGRRRGVGRGRGRRRGVGRRRGRIRRGRRGRGGGSRAGAGGRRQAGDGDGSGGGRRCGTAGFRRTRGLGRLARTGGGFGPRRLRAGRTDARARRAGGDRRRADRRDRRRLRGLIRWAEGSGQAQRNRREDDVEGSEGEDQASALRSGHARYGSFGRSPTTIERLNPSRGGDRRPRPLDGRDRATSSGEASLAEELVPRLPRSHAPPD